MTATCKTCGGTPGHHVPSPLDRNGIGDPGHKVEGTDMTSSSPDSTDRPLRVATGVEGTTLDTILEDVAESICGEWCDDSHRGADAVNEHMATEKQALTAYLEAQTRAARIDERRIFIQDDANDRNAAYLAKERQAGEHAHDVSHNSQMCSCGLSAHDLFTLTATILQETPQGSQGDSDGHSETA
jgi:hypothetical protein